MKMLKYVCNKEIFFSYQKSKINQLHYKYPGRCINRRASKYLYIHFTVNDNMSILFSLIWSNVNFEILAQCIWLRINISVIINSGNKWVLLMNIFFLDLLLTFIMIICKHRHWVAFVNISICWSNFQQYWFIFPCSQYQ